MVSLKRSYTTPALQKRSADIMQRIEETVLFRQAGCIALYHALRDEVQTADFIEKWYQKKRILLPVVQGKDLLLYQYEGKESLRKGAFGILEPTADCRLTAKNEVDLVIVPGVAFDRRRNRLGRGKGFYDRLLSTLAARTIGICYDFQLMDEIPTEPFDRKMDLIITEKETI